MTDELEAARKLAEPAPVAIPDDVRKVIEKALAHWYKASADLIFLEEDRDVELRRIDAASNWLDTLKGGQGDDR